MYSNTWSDQKTLYAIISFAVCLTLFVLDVYRARYTLTNKGELVRILWMTVLMIGLAFIIISMLDKSSSVYWDLLGGIFLGGSALIKGYAIKYHDYLRKCGFLIPIDEREYTNYKALIIGGWGFLILAMACFSPAILLK